MVQTLENIDKSKVYVDRIEGLNEVVSDVIGDTLIGAVSTITTTDLTAGKILVSDNNGKVAASNKTISDIGGDGDNLSITKNASDKLQTVGVINQNNTTTAIKTWTGTKSQYEAIVTKDNNTVYLCTNVGEIYLGTTKIVFNNDEIVHKTGIETITGYKTFKSDNSGLNPLAISCDTIDVTQTQNAYNDVVVYDTNNSVLGSYSFFQNNSGEYGFNFKIDNSGGIGYDLRFYKGTDNLNHIKIPNPTEDTTSSLEADTVGARNTKLQNYALDADVVHKTGDETITGTKSYAAMPVLIFPSEIRGTAPSSASYGGIAFLDNNGERMAILEKDHLTNGNISLNLRAINPTTTGTASQATLGVTYPMSGKPYATSPASDVNGSIVTTVNKSKAANGYFQFGNGLIINWGVTTTGGEQTITFAKAFTSTNIAITHTRASADGTNDNDAIYTITKTNFKLRIYGGAGGRWIAVGY